MSRNICLFLKQKISEERFYDFLSSLGGLKQELGYLTQGVLDINGGILWLHFRGDKFSLDENEIAECSNLLMRFTTEIGIEISSDDGSAILAKYFCNRLAGQFGELLILNSERQLVPIKDVDKVLYID